MIADQKTSCFFTKILGNRNHWRSSIAASLLFIASIPSHLVAAPTLTSAPVVSGTGNPSETLSATAGAWQDASNLTITRQWLANEQNLTGATGNSYTIPSNDTCSRFSFAETATDSAGATTTAVSNAVAKFRPECITSPSMRIWHDAKDSSTITVANGNDVTSWGNKATPSNPLNTPSSTARPYWHPNAAIRFRNDIMTAADSLDGTAEDSIQFIVQRANSYSNNFMFSLNGNDVSGTSRFSMHAPWGDGNVYLDAGSTSARAQTSTVLPTTSKTMISAVADHTNGSNKIFINGSLEASSSNTVASSSSKGLRLGTDANDHFVQEYIVFKGTMTLAQIKMMEGYLAQKWNLTGSLASDHPYKNNGSIVAPGIRTTAVTNTLIDQNNGSWSLVLAAPPTNTVTLSLSSNSSTIAPTPATLTFNASNWDQPQTAVLNNTTTNDIANATLTVSAASSLDDGYKGLANITKSLSVIYDDSPVVDNVIGTRAAAEDSAFSFAVPTNTFNDEESGTALTITLVSSLDSWLSFDDSTLTFSGTPTNSDVGSQTITLRAADPAGHTVDHEFTLNVTNTNDSPTVASALADQSTDEDAAFARTVPTSVFADVDVDDELTLSISSTLPSWLSFDGSTGQLSGTPTNDDVKTIGITVRATDKAGSYAEESFNLTVANTNDRPTVSSPIANQNADEDSVFELTIPTSTFADVDAGDELTLSISSTLPTWLSFNSTNGLLSGTPTNDDIETVNVTVRATDKAGLFVEDSFSIVVTNTNDAPTVSSPIADQNTDEDDLFELNVPSSTFVDVDAGDELTLSIRSALPSWLSYNSTTGVLTGTPTNENVGPITITVRATDKAGLFVEDSFDIVIANTNDAPTVSNSIADQNTDEDDLFELNISTSTFVDVDAGDELTLSISSSLPSWLSYNGTTRTLSGTPTNDNIETVNVTVLATDKSGLTAEDSFDIVVANTNDAPTVSSPIADQDTDEGDLFELNIPTANFADVDTGDELTLSISSALPSWLSFDSDTGLLTGTPTNANVETLAITVRATDKAGLFVEDSFNIIVANINDAPTVSTPIADKSTSEDDLFELNISTANFSDIDVGDELTLSISSTLPSWLNFNESTGLLSGTPTNDKVGTASITVRATDKAGLFAEDSFDIVVANTNDTPTVANPMTDQSTDEDALFEFTIPASTFADVDVNDQLTLSISSTLPSWLSFNSTTGLLSGTPENDDVGTTGVTVRATDIDGLSIEDSIDIAVANTNDAPVMNHANADQTAVEDMAFSYTLHADTFTDADGETLTLSTSALPDWLSFDSTTATFSGTPRNDDIAETTITVSASDAVTSANDVIRILVNNTNDAPTPNTTIENQSALEGTPFSMVFLDSTFDDVDADDSLTYSMPLLPSWLSFNPSTHTLSGTPDNADVGPHSITLRATDTAGATAEIQFDIVVENTNQGPTVDQGLEAIDINENTNLSLSIPSDTFADPDVGDTLVYSLSSGPSWLSLSHPTLSGTPAQADVGSTDVTLRATDSSGLWVETSFSINVAEVNDNPPSITSANAISVHENTTSNFYTATATDIDTGDTVTFSLTGTDAAAFSIEPNTGQLQFSANPDFENTTDVDSDNVYELTLEASDAVGNQSTSSLLVTLLDLNDNAPVFSSTTTHTTPEGATSTGYIATASDLDANDSLSYAIIGGADAAFFDIDSSTGILSFSVAADFESPADSDQNNVYEITLRVEDSAANQALRNLVISVEDTNDNAPVFTSVETVQVEENHTATGYVATSVDSDNNDTVSYSVDAELDGDLFSIDSSTGQLSFKLAPDVENPSDSNGDNIYLVTLTATDSTDNATALSLSITVTDLNDTAPTFSSSTNVSISEDNYNAGYTALATDPDSEDAPALSQSYAIDGGLDASLFSIEVSTGVIRFIDAPDYENPNDSDQNRVYLLDISATDRAGNSTSKTLQITLLDANDNAPSFTSAPAISIDEGSSGVIYTATTSDPDTTDSVQFTLVAGNEAGLFSIASDTGLLTVSSPDFEQPGAGSTNNVYTLTLRGTDAANNEKDYLLTVTVNDINDNAPSIGSSDLHQVDENLNDTSYIATATDVDLNDSLSWSLSGSTDDSLFQIDPNTGAVSFHTAPDAENPSDQNTDNVYELTLRATDGAGNTRDKGLSITVRNTNDNNPVFSSSNSTSVDEGTVELSLQVIASDADQPDSIRYEISSGDDAAFFNIDAATGALQLARALDYETPEDANGDNRYSVSVDAIDLADHRTTQVINLVVNDVNDTAPVFQSGSVMSTAEGQSDVGYTAQSTDVDTNDSVSYSLGGADAAAFTVDANGAIRFVTAADFESPHDTDSNNLYQLSVIATDAAGNTASQALDITVTDINDQAPIFTSQNTAVVDENTSAVFYNTTTTDPDTLDEVSYSITGSDAALFSISATSGAMHLKLPSDYENPNDTDADRVFDITVVATDSIGNTSSLALSIALNNVNEVPVSEEQSFHVSEFSPSGTSIAQLNATDPEQDTTLWSLITIGSPFSLSGSGELLLTETLDHETIESYTLDVMVTDGTLHSTTQVHVAVDDENEIVALVQNLPTTATELTAVGVTGAISGREEYYNAVIAASNPKPDTLAELQALIDTANAVATTIHTAENGDTDSVNGATGANSALQQQLVLAGVTDLIDENTDHYQQAIANATPSPTTPAELQSLIDEVNSVQEVIQVSEAIHQNGGDISALSSSLASLPSVPEVPDDVLKYVAAMIDRANPTPSTEEEIAALVNKQLTRVAIHPVVWLSTSQAGAVVREIRTDGGLVTVEAKIVNPLAGITDTYSWLGTDTQLLLGSSDANPVLATFTFDPSGLREGEQYTVGVSVLREQLRANAGMPLIVAAAGTTAADVSDFDDDGVSNASEGELEASTTPSASNDLQTKRGDDLYFTMESAEGTKLRLGRVARLARFDQASITQEIMLEHTPNASTAQLIGEFPSSLPLDSSEIFEYEISTLPHAGATVAVVIPLRNPLLEQAMYLKYHVATGWQDFAMDGLNTVRSAPALANIAGQCPPVGSQAFTDGLTEGHQCIELSIEDGGLNDGDRWNLDGTHSNDQGINGYIKDPGAIAYIQSGGAASGEPPELSTGLKGTGSSGPLWLLVGAILIFIRRLHGSFICNTQGARPSCCPTACAISN